MSKKHFSILFLVTILVAVAVFLMPSRTGRDASSEPGAFLPELAEVVNDVGLVRITAKGGSEVFTLQRGDQGWVVQEFSAYPADWGVLRPLLAGLAQAEVVEVKTANPEYYERLGVEDPMSEGAQGKLVEFPGNDSLPGVIVGKRAQGRDGQYLRRSDQARSVLVDQAIDLPIDSAGWLRREIVDVADDDVIFVRIAHADGEVVEIQRESTEVTDFTLNDIPEGRKTSSAWTINQLASTLSGLNLDAVAPIEDVSWDGAIDLQVRTEAGLQVDARLVEDGEHRWLSLEASGDDAAETINERTSGWAYRIPLYKFDAVNKRMEDLLAPVEEEGDDQ